MIFGYSGALSKLEVNVKRGFKFSETMTGTFALVEHPDDQRPLSFSVRVHAGSILQYLRDSRADLEGMLEAEGFADHVPIHGTIIIAPVRKRLISYEFNFTGNDGRPYYFSGHKDIDLAHPMRTLTELPAEIHDGTGKLVARSRTRFDMRSDLLRFLAGWRLT